MWTLVYGVRDAALTRLLQDGPCTIRCEESLYNRLKEAMPQIKWENNVFLPGENPYQPGALYVHVYFHSSNARIKEFKLDLRMYFKEPH